MDGTTVVRCLELEEMLASPIRSDDEVESLRPKQPEVCEDAATMPWKGAQN